MVFVLPREFIAAEGVGNGHFGVAVAQAESIEKFSDKGLGANAGIEIAKNGSIQCNVV